MWRGWAFRDTPTVDNSEATDSSDDSYKSGPPGTPEEEVASGLSDFRQAADQLATEQTLAGTVVALTAKMPPKVPYDKENKDDGEDYYKRTGNIKLEWDPDVQFWFNAIEAQMKQAQVFSQWTKREVLMPLLPKDILEEVRHLFRLSQEEAGTTPYYDIKQAIIKIFGKKPQDGIDKALTRTLTNRPSHLAKQIMDDICRCRPALNCPCCANQVYGLLRRQLPTAVRNSIAGQAFNKNTYQEVLDEADEVYYSNKDQPAVAAVQAAQTQSEKSEIAALREEVAALRNFRKNQGGQNQGGQGRGGGQSNGRGQGQTGQGRGGGAGRGGRGRGPRHSDNPPPQSCKVHWLHGKSSWHCAAPQTCPWASFTVPKPTGNN